MGLRSIPLTSNPSSTPPKPAPGKLPAELPPAPERKPKIQKTSTRDLKPAVISDEDAMQLEVNAALHDVVDQVVHEAEKQKPVILFEVRNTLNAAIDWVALHWKDAAANAFEALKPKRRVFTTKQKQAVVQLFDKCEEKSKAQKLARLHEVRGFDSVTQKMIENWAKSGPTRKRGVKVNTDFEDQVIGQLIYTEIEKVDNVEQAVVKSNVAHSHATIRLAATMVQKTAFFLKDSKIQALKFTPPWIKGFLRRAALRRRRVTAVEKVLPPVEDVRKRMGEIQTVIVQGGYTEDETISADETGVFYGAPPKNQYVPETAERATAAESDDKARFTSLLAGSVVGNMLPSFNIIKMTVKGPDLTRSRVLDNLMLKPGFSTADGWEKQIWRRQLTLTVKGKETTREYARPYLIHKATKVVITVQAKAWMDTVGMCMWADVQIGPIYRAGT